VNGDGCCPAGCEFNDSDCATRNDTCQSATDISAGGDFPLSLVGAHQDIPALPCSPDSGGPEVFFRFGLAVPSNVYLDVYDPVGNDVNVALEIYSGGGGGCPVQAIGCDADGGGLACGGGRWPRVFKPNLSAGNYVVAARGTRGVSGVYVLRFQRVPVACAGDVAVDELLPPKS